MSHTPGPWIVDDAAHPETADATYHYVKAGQGYIDEDGSGFLICGIVSLDDARLIAAAPQMYDALKACEEYFDQRADADHNGNSYVPNEEMRALQIVRAVLAKATGGAA